MKQDLRRRDDESLDALHRKMLAYEIDSRRLASEAFANRMESEKQTVRVTRLSEKLQNYVAFADVVEQTIWWRARKAVRRLLKRIDDAPRPVGVVEPTFAADDARYEYWLKLNSTRKADIDRMIDVSACLQYRPTFSVLMPVYETPETFLRAAIESVVGQAYPEWELCVVDDGSPSAYVAEVVREYAARDPRIRLHVRSVNGHIARATSDALELASGEFIALLDHDDVLQPEALFENAVALNRHPDLDYIYSDEDKIDANARRSQPSFKPDWSPDTFLTKMYTSHLAVLRRSLVETVGGFREGFDGAQDYDLILRITERTERIHHIPKILYSWRLHAGSVAENPAAKEYAYASSLRALQSALDRRDEGGLVTHASAGIGHWVIRYAIKTHEKVSVIVPTRNGADDVRRCLNSLFTSTTYPNYEVILLDNGSDRQDALDLFASFERSEPLRFRYVRHDVPFNYSRINNYAVHSSNGYFLLFLNNDTEVMDGAWMSAMVEQAQRPSIGAVGAKLIYANGTIQHAGVVLGIGGIAGHSHRHQPRDVGGYMNNVALTTNYSAVTAACMMMRRSVFTSVGGFDETFAIAYNDVDLCLRLRDAGYQNVYLPYVELMHFESHSRGYDVDAEQIERDRRERSRLQARWQQALSIDPFYNPHLSLSSEDFQLAP